MDDSSQVDEELIDITRKLGSAYAEAKRWDNRKTELRKEFFKVANESQGVLAEKIIFVNKNSLAEAIEEATKKYPDWTVLSGNKVENGFDVRLKENPDFKPFAFANPDDGLIYQRQIASGPIMFDDEKFKEDHLNLYYVVTYVPEPERQLKPFDELSSEQIAILQDYIYEGKPVVKLAAPRKIKEDEL